MPPFENNSSFSHHHHWGGHSHDEHPAAVFFDRFGEEEDLFRNHWGNHRQFRQEQQRRCQSGCPLPFRFLKKIAFAIVGISFVSMIFRAVALTLALCFSPPVLAICLALAIASSAWDYPRVSHPFWGNRRPQSGNCFGRGKGGGCRRGGFCRFLRRMKQEKKIAGEPRYAPPCSLGDIPEDLGEADIVGPGNTKDATGSAPTTSTEEESGEDDTAARTFKQTAVVRREESKESLMLALDLPGFSSADVKVSLVDSNTKLSVQGSRKNRLGDTFVVHRTFFLSKKVFDVDSISANYAEDVLEIRIDKKPAPQPRVISITTGKKKDE